MRYGRYTGSIEFKASNIATCKIASGRVMNIVGGSAPGIATVACRMRFHSMTMSVALCAFALRVSPSGRRRPRRVAARSFVGSWGGPLHSISTALRTGDTTPTGQDVSVQNGTPALYRGSPIR
jgi:hypothetical protein